MLGMLPPEGFIDLNEAVARLYGRKHGGVHRGEDGRALHDGRLALRSHRNAARKATSAPNLYETAEPVGSAEPGYPDHLDEAGLGPVLQVPADKWFLGEVAPERFVIGCKVDIREAILQSELPLAVWLLDERLRPLVPPRYISVDEAALLPLDIRPKPSTTVAEAPADQDIAWAVFGVGANQRHPATLRSQIEGAGRYPALREAFAAPRRATLILLLHEQAFEEWLKKQRAAGQWPSVRDARARAELKSAAPNKLPGDRPPGRPTKLTEELQGAVWALTDNGRWSPERGSAASLWRALRTHFPDLPLPTERSIRSWLRTGTLVPRRPD
jgi:hypothetical protein